MSEMNSGAFLQGRKYVIDRMLGQGGFGITYLAEQTNLGRKVCIKEFFMKEYGERISTPSGEADATVLTGVTAVTSAAAEIMGRYREKFIKEAKTIARLDHPGIVRIHDVFEENGTAYYVMDFIEGENLNEMVKREGPLPEERAIGYIRQVADALSYVHDRKIMHLDVKPANVLVRKSDGKAILIDFGTAKQYDASGTQTSTTPIGLSAGYAPMELMKPGGVQTFSPETDVYSLGATLYYLVTGQNPPDASERMEMIEEGDPLRFPASVSAAVADAVDRAMRTRRKRIQTVALFLEALPSLSDAAPEEIHSLFCSKCGRELAPDTRFCPMCGTAVVVEKIMDTGFENGHEWVNLGLSVRWATSNVGANYPEGYGDYFAWGETSAKINYSPSTWLGYCSPNKKKNLKRFDDAARANWGGSWRMPTDNEWMELRTRCKWTWTSRGGINGYKVTGPNGNSIFLPSAGYHFGTVLANANLYGNYWSSTERTMEEQAWNAHFNSKEVVRDYNFCYCGLSVRPVSE